MEEQHQKERRTNQMNIPIADFAVLASDVKNIKEDVIEIKALVKNDYVTKTEFEPIKKLVYGIVTLILTGVIVALLSLVVRR